MPNVSIGEFARIIGKPLYPYQIEIGDHILDSILENRGLTFSVMLARQMGKNQLSAMIEAYLLTCMPEGTIVKAAPTYKPQIVNSRLRLLSMLENPITRDRYWRSFGYMIGVAPAQEKKEAQTGPRIMFFSAGPESSIVGATASLALEIDEAQDVSIEKFDKELRPMASTQNTTTILYGTAWSDDTLLAIIKANNLELEAQDGIRRHFEHDWRTLAEINSKYKRFVETEIRRLGEDHITIRTQYRLLNISGAGFLLNEIQRHMLRGSHDWQTEPEEDTIYVAGVDVGGESRPKPGTGRSKKPDSTVITIARVGWNDLSLPSLSIVHQVEWNGKDFLEQYAEMLALAEIWNLRKIIIDKTGLGEMMASMMETKLGGTRVEAFHFTRPSKSQLTYQFLNLVSSGRIKMYKEDEAPEDIFNEAWKQLKMARYSIPGQDLLNMYVDPEDGHDDYLISIALCGEAIKEWITPVVEAQVVRPERLYQDESRY